MNLDLFPFDMHKTDNNKMSCKAYYPFVHIPNAVQITNSKFHKTTTPGVRVSRSYNFKGSHQLTTTLGVIIFTSPKTAGLVRLTIKPTGWAHM